MVANPAPSAVRVDRVALVAGSMGTRITAALGDVLDEGLVDTTTICVLCALERDGQLRPRDVQALTPLTSGGTTNLLDRLAALDLVSRSHDTVSGDRRAVVVALTASGRRIVAATAGVFAAEAASIRSFLAELEAELGGREPEGAPPDDPGRATPGAASGSSGAAVAVSRDVLDAIIGLAQLGFALRRALVTGLHPETYFENPVAVVLGALMTGGPRRPRDLQPLLGMTSGGTTKLLFRIERSGLIALDRHRLEADRRATIVSITALGRRAMAEASASLAAHADELRAIIREVDAALAR